MTNRKKEMSTAPAAEVKHLGISAAAMPTSQLKASSSSSANTESLVAESNPYAGICKGSPVTERRRARRFQLCTPVTIRWSGDGDEVREAMGIVRDISTCGVYVEAALSLGKNENVELEIVPLGLLSGSKTELHFEGKIVRSEPRASRPGVAVGGFLWLAKADS